MSANERLRIVEISKSMRTSVLCCFSWPFRVFLLTSFKSFWSSKRDHFRWYSCFLVSLCQTAPVTLLSSTSIWLNKAKVWWVSGRDESNSGRFTQHLKKHRRDLYFPTLHINHNRFIQKPQKILIAKLIKITRIAAIRRIGFCDTSENLSITTHKLLQTTLPFTH